MDFEHEPQQSDRSHRIAADTKTAMTLAASMSEVMRKGLSERRSDKRVPSVYAERVATAKQYPEVETYNVAALCASHKASKQTQMWSMLCGVSFANHMCMLGVYAVPEEHQCQLQH